MPQVSLDIPVNISTKVDFSHGVSISRFHGYRHIDNVILCAAYQRPLINVTGCVETCVQQFNA
jgi:hypothetical protein